MITKRNTLEIIVNGQPLEFTSQDSINLRINNNTYDPEKLSVTQSEYSFSFTVPTSPNNNKAFGFSNTPSVRGKFIRNYNTYVYADGIEIFKGLLRISSIEEDEYKCNLISVKVSDLEDIFGEDVMSDLTWEIPYTGADTINSYNSEDNPDLFFPLVAYGVFQKEPYRTISSDSETLKYYTGTNVLDKWTKYYGETFIPSPKLIEVIKRMIERKGYTYSGDVFSDDLINKIYLSSYLSSDQDPAYNYGGKRGEIQVSFSYDVKASSAVTVNGRLENTVNYPTDVNYFAQRNSFDYEPLSSMDAEEVWIRNLWDKNYCNTLYTNQNNTLWENDYIIIPHDGYYKVRLDCYVTLMSTNKSAIDDSLQYKTITSTTEGATSSLKRHNYTRSNNFDNINLEIQLVKNNSTDLEFICPMRIDCQNTPSISSTAKDSIKGQIYDYPHEVAWSKSSDGKTYECYIQPQGKTRAYEPSVNEDFIMGFSTMARSYAIQRKGRGWRDLSDYNYNNYKCEGYTRLNKTVSGNSVTFGGIRSDHTSGGDTFGGQRKAASTTNSYTETPNTDYQNFQDGDVPNCNYTVYSNIYHGGQGYAIMWFNKNDMITCKSLMRKYKKYSDDETSYTCYEPGYNVTGTVRLWAWSPNKKDVNKSWNGTSSFSENLNIGNFLSDEETQLDFFNNFLTTFNLTVNIVGKNIDINKNVKTINTQEAVHVDDRINPDECELEPINFPTSTQVKFTTSDEESGFYHSVPDEHINDDDWKDWAETGTEKIKLISNPFKTNDLSKTSKFSYNWYMDFQLTDFYTSPDVTSHVTNGNVILKLPIIAKDENFIDGYDYEEMMKTDGRSLKQRLWFKAQNTQYYVPNRNGAVYTDDNLTSATEFINICLPTEYYNGEKVLDYHNNKYSLLKRYFNINQDVHSNYCTIEVYLTPQEYIRIKNGSMVKFDDDRYRIVSVTGYDPTNGNKTKLKLMKL